MDAANALEKRRQVPRRRRVSGDDIEGFGNTAVGHLIVWVLVVLSVGCTWGLASMAVEPPYMAIGT